MVPSIAVIDRNGLSLEALGDILQELFSMVDVCLFHSMEEFFSDCNRYFVHFFVSEDIMISNAAEFECLKDKTIVCCQGPGQRFADAGFRTLNVFRTEKHIIGDIVNIHDGGHRQSLAYSGNSKVDALSGREKEVLALMVKGLYNKEIADKLNISVATAIFHRNNICEKLGTRSIGRLTICAILSGLVTIDEV